MQEVKYYMRTIGDVRQDPSGALNVKSGADVEAELAYEYLSKGWKLFSTHPMGSIRGGANNDEIAYRILHVLVREDYAPPVVEAKKK